MRATPLRRAALLLALVGSAACAHAPPPAPPPPPPARAARAVTVVTFYDSLSPHGEWILITGIGRVWRPWNHVVGVHWVPYSTAGRWEHSDVGWVFVSDYEWGGIVFHYGRWAFIDPYGWVWVPDTVWGPAWVEWRYGGGYVCWAPMPPAVIFEVVVVYHPIWWVVPTRHFVHGHHHHYRVHEHAAEHIVHRAAPVPPHRRASGPDWQVGPARGDVERDTRIAVKERSVAPAGALPPQVLDVPRTARIREVPRPRTGVGGSGQERGAEPRPPPGRPEPQRIEPSPAPPPTEIERAPRAAPPARVEPERRAAPPKPPAVEPPRPATPRPAPPVPTTVTPPAKPEATKAAPKPEAKKEAPKPPPKVDAPKPPAPATRKAPPPGLP